MTTADESPWRLVSRSWRALELSSRRRKRFFRFCAPLFFLASTTPELPHTKPAVLPFLPADDGCCERSTPLTHHLQGSAPFRDFRSLLLVQ